jgi:hypothetical protein
MYATGNALYIADAGNNALRRIGGSEPASFGERADAGNVGDPVNAATGNFFHEESDVGFPAQVSGMDFGRFYNAQDKTTGPLGRGWTHSLATEITEEPAGVVTLREPDGRQLDFYPDGGSYLGLTRFGGHLILADRRRKESRDGASVEVPARVSC